MMLLRATAGPTASASRRGSPRVGSIPRRARSAGPTTSIRIWPGASCQRARGRWCWSATTSTCRAAATTSTSPTARSRPTCRGSTSSTGCWSTCRRARARSPRAHFSRGFMARGKPGPRSDAAAGGPPGTQRLHGLVRVRPGDARRLLRLRRAVPAVERLARPPLRLHALRARRAAARRSRAASPARHVREAIGSHVLGRGDAFGHVHAEPAPRRRGA